MDSDESESVVCRSGLVAERFGVLFECAIEVRLRVMAGGVALPSPAEAVEIDAEDGPVTMEAFEDLRLSLGPGVRAACIWVTLSGEGVAEA